MGDDTETTTTTTPTTTKPSYVKMLIAALVDAPPIHARTFAEVCSAIDSKYGRCSAKCLRKAVSRAVTSEDVVVEGSVENIQDETRIMLCARRRRLVRRRIRREQRTRPKPKTAYNMYVREQIPLRRQTGSEVVTSIMRDIARDWDAVNTEERAEYQRQADDRNSAEAA